MQNVHFVENVMMPRMVAGIRNLIQQLHLLESDVFPSPYSAVYVDPLHPMEKGFPVQYRGPFQQRGTRFRLLTFAVIALTALSFTIQRKFDGKRVVRVPFNANAVTARCKALNVNPGPPPGFDSRTQSDRYQPDTPDVLIRNATIWTGSMDGNEIVTGDILLSSGLIEVIGTQINVAGNVGVTTIDARVSLLVFMWCAC